VPRTITLAKPEPLGLPVPPSDEQKHLYFGPQHRWVLAVQSLAFLGVAYSLVRFALHVEGALLFIAFVALYGVGLCVSLRSSTRRRRLTLPEHQALVDGYAPERFPSVDVFLPSAGEPMDLLANTYRHVAGLQWPGELSVLVLDDSARAEVRELAERHGFRYLTRPDRGHLKKAGNLAYGTARSDGDLIVVFDADFVPREDFVLELAPYFDDPGVGIVQSPQYFDVDRRMTWLQRTAGATQEVFYRWVQPARDAADAAICVGTNAIYRRAALAVVGGFAQIEHSEDVHTGVKMLRAGFRTRYVPVLLARGLCPDEFAGFVNQQYRWCTGSMSLLRGWSIVGAQLNWNQRLCFWSGFLYYIGTAVAIFVSPLPTIIMLWRLPHEVRPSNYLPLIGGMLVWFLLLPMMSRARWRVEVIRVQMLYSFAHAVAVADTLKGITAAWVPTGAVRKPSPLVGRVRRLLLTWLLLVQTAQWVGVLRGMDEFGLGAYWTTLLFSALQAYIAWPLIVLAWPRREKPPVGVHRRPLHAHARPLAAVA
jgi:cellulose synthase (UDP-forming)